MSEFKEKIARKFLRRSSAQSSGGPASPSSNQTTTATTSTTRRPSSPLPKQRPSKPSLFRGRSHGPSSAGSGSGVVSPRTVADRPSTQPETPKPRNYAQERVAPTLTVQEPSPDVEVPQPRAETKAPSIRNQPLAPPTPISAPATPSGRNSSERRSILPTTPEHPPPDTPPTLQEEADTVTSQQDYFGAVKVPHHRKMGRRKVWIKRAGASPTLVQINDEDLVDDMRDMVLRKYGNSLGRTWDSPDVQIKVVPRERSHQERFLNPEEPICQLLDAYFPGGQQVGEALLVEVPRKRTPQPSPRILYPHAQHHEDSRPMENGTDYFPPMPAGSPHPSNDSRHSASQAPAHAHSIGILETGQLPPLPSPREPRDRRSQQIRPKAHRQHTSSPTYVTSSSQIPIGTSLPTSRPKHVTRTSAPAPPPMPTPPAHEGGVKTIPSATTPPLDRVGSPRPNKKKRNKPSVTKAQQVDPERRPSHPQPQILSLIEATVPPINVLIVEDNPINLRLLEMFTKRLKVRWSTAMNGRDAVTKWRAGGFHLVLMDIQLPIMSGLEATKEIRRLERVNSIGVFAKSSSEDTATPRSQSITQADGSLEDAQGDDKLSAEGSFKSPVIIVALTASSLQSDRHEALAAGCNDFLTKPVHFPWLERKVMEWGCMQALIDFDGWRRWKDMAAAVELEKQKTEDNDPEAKAKREKKEAKRAATLAKMNMAG